MLACKLLGCSSFRVGRGRCKKPPAPTHGSSSKGIGAASSHQVGSLAAGRRAGGPTKLREVLWDCNGFLDLP